MFISFTDITINKGVKMKINANIAQSASNFSSHISKYDANFTYGNLTQMSNAIIARGKDYERDYGMAFKGGGSISLDELNSKLKSEFKGATFVSYDPQDAPQSGTQIYIDDANLKRMARDENYRAKIFGLIKRETESGSSGYSFLDGENKTRSVSLGVAISISDKNDGEPPYRGYSRGSFYVESSDLSGINGSRNNKTNEIDEFQKRLKKKNEEQKAEEKKLEARYAHEKSLQKHFNKVSSYSAFEFTFYENFSGFYA